MNKIYFILILLFISCANSQIQYEKHEFIISMNKELKIKVFGGSHEILDTVNNSYISKIVFDRVVGGKSYFLGFKVSEGNGYQEERLHIFKNDDVIKKLSITSLKEFQDSIINLEL